MDSRCLSDKRGHISKMFDTVELFETRLGGRNRGDNSCDHIGANYAHLLMSGSIALRLAVKVIGTHCTRTAHCGHTFSRKEIEQVWRNPDTAVDSTMRLCPIASVCHRVCRCGSLGGVLRYKDSILLE